MTAPETAGVPESVRKLAVKVWTDMGEFAMDDRIHEALCRAIMSDRAARPEATATSASVPWGWHHPVHGLVRDVNERAKLPSDDRFIALYTAQEPAPRSVQDAPDAVEEWRYRLYRETERWTYTTRKREIECRLNRHYQIEKVIGVSIHDPAALSDPKREASPDHADDCAWNKPRMAIQRRCTCGADGGEASPDRADAAGVDYEKCEDCGGSGLAINMAGETDECRECSGNTVVPALAPADKARRDAEEERVREDERARLYQAACAPVPEADDTMIALAVAASTWLRLTQGVPVDADRARSRNTEAGR